MPNPLLQILTQEDIDKLNLPLGEAAGLPPAAYLDDAFFDLEVQNIFRRTWMAVAFTHDIPNSGDAMPVSVGGVNIILVRDQQGQINALHNVCRHRAATVLNEPVEGLNALRCLYHCWTYNLDGSFKHAPFFDGTAAARSLRTNPKANGLVPIRCENWQNVIFVDISGEAQDFEGFVQPLTDRWSKYDLDSLSYFKSDSKSIAANWKIVMEGLLEVYHEEFIHEALTYRLTENGERLWEDFVIGETMGFASTMPQAENVDQLPALQRLPGMPKSGAAPSEIFLLFPSVSLNVFEDHFVSTIWTPANIKETSWRSSWYFHPDATQLDSDGKLRDAIIDFWRQVRLEDLRAVLAVQQGMESLGAIPHDIRYSPFWEDILQKFHQHIVKAMT